MGAGEVGPAHHPGDQAPGRGRPLARAAGGPVGQGAEDQMVAVLETDAGRRAAVSATMSGSAEIVGTHATAQIIGHLVFPRGVRGYEQAGSSGVAG